MRCPPRRPCEPACQVKNACELFRHMQHMIIVAQECAELLRTIKASQDGAAPPRIMSASALWLNTQACTE